MGANARDSASWYWLAAVLPTAVGLWLTRGYLMDDALITLRVERAYCGSSVKDGDFAIAWLRVGVSRPGVTSGAAHLVRVSLDNVAYFAALAIVAFVVRRR